MIGDAYTDADDDTGDYNGVIAPTTLMMLLLQLLLQHPASRIMIKFMCAKQPLTHKQKERQSAWDTPDP